ncbi:predicted GPI-anchored protein 58 [Sinocyclocheilus anshuiensis]|uniref:predicted GPI-anchored protein 58 n=1 Tax=Sinocyclocheilus anshuiensis TaxID=1608454 RepID=UPI0007B8FAF2|nr:PREDICTED: predicted GPI-anchored protein 58 [Sinocyclocheilus anshuiensis]
MGPAGNFLNVCQGDRCIEDYARDFVGVARQSATERTCSMVCFWGGLTEPFKSLMPFWHPEEALEDYVNLALQLSGSAVRMELAAEPAHSSPEAAIPGSSEASSAAPSTSRPFLEHRGLVRSVREPPLMSVRAAWSARRFPEAAVSARSSPEAAVSARSYPEAAVELASVFFKAAAPHTPLWWPLVLPWVPIPPALPQSPGPPLPHGPGPPIPPPTPSPFPGLGARERLEAVP